MRKYYGTIRNNEKDKEADIIVDTNELIGWGEAFKAVLPAGIGCAIGTQFLTYAFESIPKKYAWKYMSTGKRIASVAKVLAWGLLAMATGLISGLLTSKFTHEFILKGADAYYDAEEQALKDIGYDENGRAIDETAETGEDNQN